MDKCQRFLESLRTPAELRKMKSSELELMDTAVYGGRVEETENDQSMVTEQEETELLEVAVEVNDQIEETELLEVAVEATETNAIETGPVNFGNLGFIHFTGGQEDSDDEIEEDDQNKENSADVSGANQPKEPNVVDNIHSATVEQNSSTLNNNLSTANETPNGDTDIAATETLKRAADDATTVTQKKKKKRKTADARKEKAKKEKKEKNDRAAKKGFTDNFLTIKFKLSEVQVKAGECPDFALFIKDNVHSPDARPAAQTAGKYITFLKGDITEKFFSKQGIQFDPYQFYLCENEFNLKEDRILPLNRNIVAPTNEVIELEADNKEVADESSDDSDDAEDSDDTENDEDSDSDIEPDVFNMQNSAKKVSWGAPRRENSPTSDNSSAGVNVYGRGAEKTMSKEKKKKKTEKKKRSKEAADRSVTDLLNTAEFQFQKAGTSKGTGQKGRGRGRGQARGGRGSSGRGRGSGKKVTKK